MKPVYAIVAAVFLYHGAALAQEVIPTPEEVKEELKLRYQVGEKDMDRLVEAVRKERDEKYKRLLGSDDPSYLAYTFGNKSDENAEFFISIKYPFGKGKNCFYFIYNGKYDFFVVSRESSPVVSRLQNPGVAYDFELRKTFFGLKGARAGYFHESNGQTISTAAQFNSTRHAEDFVSRGWDYVGLDLKFANYDHRDEGNSKGDMSLKLRGRYFLDRQGLGLTTREDDIFWKAVKDQPTISEYDGLRADFNYFPLNDAKINLFIRTGNHDVDSITKNLSARISASYRVPFPFFDISVPLTAFYFNGYGSEIAWYNESSTYYGVGLEYW